MFLVQTVKAEFGGLCTVESQKKESGGFEESMFSTYMTINLQIPVDFTMPVPMNILLQMRLSRPIICGGVLTLHHLHLLPQRHPQPAGGGLSQEGPGCFISGFRGDTVLRLVLVLLQQPRLSMTFLCMCVRACVSQPARRAPCVTLP